MREGKVVVLGLGNVLRRDDGAGLRALSLLRERLRPREGREGGDEGAPTGVELVDGAASPFEALAGKGGGKLVVLDAAKGGGRPGTIYRAGCEALSGWGPRATFYPGAEAGAASAPSPSVSGPAGSESPGGVQPDRARPEARPARRVRRLESEAMSLHGMGLIEALVQLALSGDSWDETVVLGIEPADLDWGEALSPAVEKALPRLVEAAAQETGLDLRAREPKGARAPESGSASRKNRRATSKTERLKSRA